MAAAAAAARQPEPNLQREETVKTSRLANGLTVTSVERQGALSRIAVAFRAGARYESDNTLGITHRLRTSVGLASRGHSAYELMWRNGILGAQLAATTTKDLFVVHMDVYRDYAVPGLEVLGEMACRPALKAWELHDTNEMLTTERAVFKSDHTARLSDLLHQAAYRTGPLGHTLRSPEFMVGKHTPNMMSEFVRRHLVSGECAVTGINVDHAALLAYAAEHMPVNDGGQVAVPSSPYRGGERRKGLPGNMTYVALAGHAAGLNTLPEVVAASVLAACLGPGVSVSWPDGAGPSKTAMAISKSIKDAPFALTGLQEVHCDQGLVGMFIASHKEHIGTVVKEAHGHFERIAKEGPNKEELDVAKRVAVGRLLMGSEKDGNVLDDATAQVGSCASVLCGELAEDDDHDDTADNDDTLPSAPKRPRKGEWPRVFAKELRCVMFGLGDNATPYKETVDVLDQLVVDYIKQMTVKCMQVGKPGKVALEDVWYLTRRDARKYARVKDMLSMNEELKRARKAFDEAKY